MTPVKIMTLMQTKIMVTVTTEITIMIAIVIVTMVKALETSAKAQEIIPTVGIAESRAVVRIVHRIVR